MPELHEHKKITWNMHVARDLCSYDMIIGQNLLEFLGIYLLFSKKAIAWSNAMIPFKDVSGMSPGLYYIRESSTVTAATNRIKEILDEKYQPADLDQICQDQKQLSIAEQAALKNLLQKYSTLFDGTLGKWKGQKLT